jgi:adenylosuccinate lyase
MSDSHNEQSDFERRINNRLKTIIETQANLQEAIAGLIQVARIQDERIDRIDQQMEENSKQIAALIEQGKETREDLKQMKDAVNALIRIVEGPVSNHP